MIYLKIKSPTSLKFENFTVSIQRWGYATLCTDLLYAGLVEVGILELAEYTVSIGLDLYPSGVVLSVFLDSGFSALSM